jgi:WD40 repeat protein
VNSPSSSVAAESIVPSLATAFTALPDIAASSRGSGVVTDWQQHSGVLAVGGNSETIRLWDVAKEQCCRVLYTGMAKCTTSISTQSVSYNKFSAAETGSDYYRMAQMMNHDKSDIPSHWTWMFAGFGDGSVSVYDQRVPSNGGRVHAAREDNHWIVHVQIREDIPEVSL